MLERVYFVNSNLLGYILAFIIEVGILVIIIYTEPFKKEEEQLNTSITIGSSELNSIASTPNFTGGEVITMRDALYFMMLASSNVAPSAIARSVGEMIIRAEHAHIPNP